METYKIEVNKNELLLMLQALMYYKIEIYDCMSRTRNEETWNELADKCHKATCLQKALEIINDPPF